PPRARPLLRRSRHPPGDAAAQSVHRQWRDDRLGRYRAFVARACRRSHLRGAAALAARCKRRSDPSRQGVMAVVVLGAGAWGTALANLAAASGQPGLMSGRDPAQVQAIARQRENRFYLPGIALAANLEAVPDIGCSAEA